MQEFRDGGTDLRGEVENEGVGIVVLSGEIRRV
jgi:hypothetical protein